MTTESEKFFQVTLGIVEVDSRQCMGFLGKAGAIGTPPHCHTLFPRKIRH